MSHQNLLERVITVLNCAEADLEGYCQSFGFATDDDLTGQDERDIWPGRLTLQEVRELRTQLQGGTVLNAADTEALTAVLQQSQGKLHLAAEIVDPYEASAVEPADPDGVCRFVPAAFLQVVEDWEHALAGEVSR